MELSVDELVQYGWTLTCAALVLFMQAGFCCLEAGMVRHKNSINVALKNIADMCCSFAAFFVLGYGLMFGASQAGWIGTPMLFMTGADTGTTLSFLFQVTFCATAATIVSGGVAERCRFLPYVLASLVIAIMIYPAFGHWVWGGGWLSELGYHDFAGSSVVHMVGAGVALAGIQVLGPRAGRFTDDGRPRQIPASNMAMVAVGVVILTFGWIGFNGGSGALGADTPLIVTNTLLAACFGGLVVMLVSWAYGGLASADLVLNGVLGGLVAITAGADCVSLQASCLIGACGGLAVVITTPLLLKLKLDDAVGAVPVHGAAGLMGVLLMAGFAPIETLATWGLDGRLDALRVQAIGAGTCLAWSYGTGLIMWWLISRILPLRIGVFEEQVGLNYSEHQVANPLQDLTAAMSGIGSMERTELLRRLDNAGTGDSAALSQAIKQLITNGEEQAKLARQLGNGLVELRERLSDQQQTGLEAHRSCQELVVQTEESIDRILQYLAEHRDTDAAVPLLADLLTTARERLARLVTTLPRNAATWKAVESAVHNLDGMLITVRRSTR